MFMEILEVVGSIAVVAVIAVGAFLVGLLYR